MCHNCPATAILAYSLNFWVFSIFIRWSKKWGESIKWPILTNFNNNSLQDLYPPWFEVDATDMAYAEIIPESCVLKKLWFFVQAILQYLKLLWYRSTLTVFFGCTNLLATQYTVHYLDSQVLLPTFSVWLLSFSSTWS